MTTYAYMSAQIRATERDEYPTAPLFTVRIGELGVTSRVANNHNQQIAAEVVQYHGDGDTHHIIAFVYWNTPDETPDIRFVGGRPFRVNWSEFRRICAICLDCLGFPVE